MSISANELRIGNWVDAGQLGHTQIASIGLSTVGYGNPIPLTPEILEKCGFVYEHDQIGMMYRIKNFVMFYDGEGIGRNYGMDATDEARMDVNCKSLHQLQNLYFALTNTELNYTP